MPPAGHPPARLATPAIVALVALLALGALAAGACSLFPPLAGGDGVLVAVEASGGMCPEGLCRTRVEIRADATARRGDGEPVRLNPLLVARLAGQIRSADFTAIRSRPFTGACPTAYDGQELRYEFAAPGGQVSLSSCQVAIDPTDPLFTALAEALAAVP
jgi:hypothetical protein